MIPLLAEVSANYKVLFQSNKEHVVKLYSQVILCKRRFY